MNSPILFRGSAVKREPIAAGSAFDIYISLSALSVADCWANQCGGREKDRAGSVERTTILRTSWETEARTVQGDLRVRVEAEQKVRGTSSLVPTPLDPPLMTLGRVLLVEHGRSNQGSSSQPADPTMDPTLDE